MESIIRGHHAYKYFIDRALGKDFTGTALFAASVRLSSALNISEDCPVLAEYSLSASPLWRFQYARKTLEAPPPQNCL